MGRASAWPRKGVPSNSDGTFFLFSRSRTAIDLLFSDTHFKSTQHSSKRSAELVSTAKPA